ncbi:DNA-directed RNA polymerase subunit D [Candidatus Woesearchaeota archaeon]|nr:DNA-directed RNA polymerase subunit D [Candidatus Woesearchaeota archaeon]
MNVKLLSKENNSTFFLFKGINPVIANTMRRLIINEVPVMAIEDVEIVKNSSALYDETIAHRLGLIPLETDLKSYDLPEECKCEGKGCQNCQLKLSLKSKGPCIVNSSELKSQDPKIRPAFDNIPIVKLLKDQELVLQATAVLGKGLDHMKFSPALVIYMGVPELKTNSQSNVKGFIEKAPKGLCKQDGKNISVDDPLKWTEACFDLAAENNIEVKLNEEDFIFEIESWGQLKIKEILSAVTKILDKKLDELSKHLKKIKK